MKKRRVILPLLALLFAIVGAFATGNMKTSNLEDVRVTDPESECEEIGTCVGSGGVCEIDTATDALDVNSDNCSVPADGTFDPDF